MFLMKFEIRNSVFEPKYHMFLPFWTILNHFGSFFDGISIRILLKLIKITETQIIVNILSKFDIINSFLKYTIT